MSDTDFDGPETWTDEQIEHQVADEQQEAARGDGPTRPEDRFPVEYEFDGPGSWDASFGDLATFGPAAATELGWHGEYTPERLEADLIGILKDARRDITRTIKRIEDPDYTTQYMRRAYAFSKREKQLEQLDISQTIDALQQLQKLRDTALDLAVAKREADKAESRRLEAERRQTPEWAAKRREQLRALRDEAGRRLADPNWIVVR